MLDVSILCKKGNLSRQSLSIKKSVQRWKLDFASVLFSARIPWVFLNAMIQGRFGDERFSQQTDITLEACSTRFPTRRDVIADREIDAKRRLRKRDK